MKAFGLLVQRVVPEPVMLALALGSTLLVSECDRTQRTEPPVAAVPYVQAADPVEAGRYLVTIGGCNDCHTAGFPEANGNVPEAEWLTGVPIGFRGPWGTSYPSNLRLLAQDLTEDAWVQMVHTRQALPPMPWPSLNHMSEADSRAIYRYLQALGPKGERMPLAVGPDREPATPYFNLEPQHMERMQTVSLEAVPDDAPVLQEEQ